MAILAAVFCISCNVLVACPSMDVNGDCFVDIEDFAVFSGQWLTGNHLSPDMALISAGTFQMGDSFGEVLD